LRKETFAQKTAGRRRRKLLPGLSPRNIGEKFQEGQEPAEPDDPNSSTLNPNVHTKLGVGRLGLFRKSLWG